MTSQKVFKIDPSKPFQFISVEDHGDACCPHCGAEGRYIYSWAEHGVIKSAMAGCYAALTGQIKKDDITSFIERLSVKQAKNKPLNGWDKTVIRMQQYILDNQNDESKLNWANGKIHEAVASAKQYQFKFNH